MTWLIYAILAAIMSSFFPIVNRYLMKKEETDSVVTGFYWGLAATLFTIPFLVMGVEFPTQPIGWTILAAAVLLWSLARVVVFKAMEEIDASLYVPLSQIRILFILILSVLLLNETITTTKLIGTTLIFISAFILTSKKGQRLAKLKDKGVQLTLLNVIIFSLGFLTVKLSIPYMSPGVYLFVTYLTPSLFLLPLLKNRKKAFNHMGRKLKKPVIVSAFLSVGSYAFILQALETAETSLVYPITQLSLLLSIFLGYVILKEKKDAKRKLIGSLFAILGALFIAGVVTL
ncbi:MAG: EamA family transporter [Candidatus Diapherotrites archaeon]|nr:EamA family transporter [Candidatus Diapherotrites archaeon]